MQRLVERLHRDRKAPKTVRNVIGTLHSVLGLAVDRRLLASNPCDMTKLPDVRRDDTIRFLTQAELERVLAAPPPAFPYALRRTPRSSRGRSRRSPTRPSVATTPPTGLALLVNATGFHTD